MGKATASVTVLYASDYGFSDRLSQTLARGITKAGVATDMLDLLSADPQVLLDILKPRISCAVLTSAPPFPCCGAQMHTLRLLFSTIAYQLLKAEFWRWADMVVVSLVGAG